jgi:hypothetical protein
VITVARSQRCDAPTARHEGHKDTKTQNNKS